MLFYLSTKIGTYPLVKLIVVCQYVDMVCPFCGKIKTSVKNSRSSNRRGQVWRRRQCERCGRLFTTRESVEVGFLEVMKRSGALESYSRAKLLRSLLLTTDHLEDADAALALADTIETNVLSSLPADAKSVSSATISDAAQAVLKRYDARSYVKYLSYQTETLDAAELRRKLVRNSK